MKKILVIEDEEDIRADVVKMLGYEGFDAIGAENGRVGVRLAKQHHPDLILCDIMMPGLNGYQVLKHLRSNLATVSIPFIFLTARSSKEDVRRGMRLGADDYLAKPFTITELLEAIQSRFERQADLARPMEDLRVSLGVIMPSEIRNALTGILGFAEFLLQPEMLPGLGEVAEIGKVIVESGVELQRLVENHLLYTELRLLDYHPDHSSPWFQPEEIETESFLAFFAKYLAKKAKRTADLRLQLTDTSLYFSPKSLQKILLEILENAFAYSSSGQVVRVKSLVEDEYFILQIMDNGKGMSEEQIADIGRFTQFTDNWYDTQQGSGMGLILAQLLTRLHGGRLVIKSTPELSTAVVVALPYIKSAKGGRHEHHSTD